MLDLALLLFFAAVGASMLNNEAPALRAGVLTAAGLGIVGGFVFLRAPGSLGPLDRIRNWNAFRAVRTTPMRILIELLLLRFFFVLAFIGLAAVALAAYDIQVPIGDLVINVAAVALIAALPIAFSGLGTGQAAFVYLLATRLLPVLAIWEVKEGALYQKWGKFVRGEYLVLGKPE